MTIELNKASVIIYIEPKSGLGDVSSAVAIAKIFAKKGLKSERIILAAPSEWLARVQLFTQVRKFTVLSSQEALKILNISFTLLYPSSGIQALPYQPPCVHVTECAMNLPPSFSGIALELGLDPSMRQVGVLFDSELIEKSRSGPEEAFSHFEDLDPALKEIILQGSSLETFRVNRALYYGYAHLDVSCLAYVLAIIQLSKKDTTIVLPLPPTRLATIFCHESSMKLLEDTLEKEGFSSIDVVIFDQTHKEATMMYNKKKEGQLGHQMMIIIGPLNHKDIKLLQLCSLKETICTGDRSHHEAICSNKAFIYETLPHKKSYSEQITSLYKDLEIPFSYEIDRSLELVDVSSMMLAFFKKVRSDNYVTLCRLNNKILAEHSANGAFEETLRLLSLLAEENPITAKMHRPHSAPLPSRKTFYDDGF